MKLNKEKLDKMVEAVMKATHAPKELEHDYEFNYKILNTRLRIRTALTPFAMEMTDEEIKADAKLRYFYRDSTSTDWDDTDLYRYAFRQGAKFIRDKQIDQ